MEEDMDVGDGEAEGGDRRADGGDHESDGKSDGVDRRADGRDGEDRVSDAGDGESDGRGGDGDGGDRESDGGDGDREDSESDGDGESNGGDHGADGGDHESDGGDGESDGGDGVDGDEGGRESNGGDRGHGADIGDRVAGRDGGNQRWQLFVKGLGGKTTIIRLNRNATVDRLINVISASNGIPPESQRVLYTTKQLEYGRGKRLSDYNIQDKSTLFVVLRLRGGSNTTDTSSSSLKTLPEDVERTEEPDMISGEDDPNTPRARMSCGHAITPETLYIYCQSLLSVGKYIFQCPYISDRTGEHCGEEWSYIDVRRLADLSQDDQKRFETMISQNYLRRGRGIQECPRCKSYCERMSNVCRRVVCPLCTVRDGQEYHFCWYCLHSWDTPGNSYCGNHDCRGEDRRLEILRTCSRKTIVGVPGCPAIRACLTCGMLIEHDRACKHMTCICEEKFCFICLTPAILGNYQCGTFNSPCEVADVQTAIPGDD